jgi:hypothetical protein
MADVFCRATRAGSEGPSTRKANNLIIRNAAVAAADKLPFQCC